MSITSQCPFGFEDGQVIGYRAAPSSLILEYQFWNDKTGNLIFDGFVGLRDHCAIGVAVANAIEKSASDFVDVLSRRLNEGPGRLDCRCFQFLDLDDQPMLEIVAKSCTFVPAASS